MKKFSVLLRGDNFLIDAGDSPQRLGFYTMRYVEAEDEGEAEARAVDLLRQDTRLREVVLNDPSDPPMLFAEEIDELDSFDGIESLTPGLAFFDEQQADD
jgi:hypothetical protein